MSPDRTQFRRNGRYFQMPSMFHSLRAGEQIAAAHLCSPRARGQDLRLFAVSAEILLSDRTSEPHDESAHTVRCRCIETSSLPKTQQSLSGRELLNITSNQSVIWNPDVKLMIWPRGTAIISSLKWILMLQIKSILCSVFFCPAFQLVNSQLFASNQSYSALETSVLLLFFVA